jgi:hypothetical protein
MSAIAAALRPIPIPNSKVLRRDPAAQAFMLLRITFTVAPILFGIDKFANVLTNDWTRYLAPEFNDIIPGTAADAMHIVGVVEIVAGLVVLFSPRFGGFLVARLARGHHHQPADHRRLRRHRAARLRPDAGRTHPGATRDRVHRSRHHRLPGVPQPRPVAPSENAAGRTREHDAARAVHRLLRHLELVTRRSRACVTR